MKRKKDRSVSNKFLVTICSLAFLVAAVSMFFVGLQAVTITILAASLVGAGILTGSSGDGVLALVVAVFEGLLEGVLLIMEGIAAIIAGIFG